MHSLDTWTLTVSSRNQVGAAQTQDEQFIEVRVAGLTHNLEWHTFQTKSCNNRYDSSGRHGNENLQQQDIDVGIQQDECRSSAQRIPRACTSLVQQHAAGVSARSPLLRTITDTRDTLLRLVDSSGIST
ncbi:hypothetical protein C0Q70_05385 [Pomacea canaliculata]|uniref:Uncharacterized protein n=1 Tax=Pomacea canaliculata TaxID=400727 RepID=A0A2T7PL49_POMCA|nr:hypothetical protein C0Q70_05385 [Pomacea canaliculata]